MDLFDAFPGLRSLEHEDLKEKSLRLIGLSGLARDDSHYYFEFSKPKMWGTLDGNKVVGVGTARLVPNSQRPVHNALVNYIRKTWRCDARIQQTEHMLIQNTNRELSQIKSGVNGSPFIVMLTPPRLGGSVMPDALAQVVYQVEITRMRSTHRTNLLRVEREHLLEMLEGDIWDLSTLKQTSWADIRLIEPLPINAKVRPVLGLRALKAILDAGLYSV